MDIEIFLSDKNFPSEINFLHKILDYPKKTNFKQEIIQWLKILFKNPFNLHNFNRKNELEILLFSLKNYELVSILISNYRKNKEDEYFFSTDTHFSILNRNVEKYEFYDFLRFFSREWPVQKKYFTNWKNSSFLIEKFSVEIYCNQAVNNFTSKEQFSELLNHRNEEIGEITAYAFSKFLLDDENLIENCFSTVFKCEIANENRWKNLLIAFAISQKNILADSIFFQLVDEKIMQKIIFYEKFDCHSKKIRAAGLFLIYCMMKYKKINFNRTYLITIALTDADYECRRAAYNCLMEGQALSGEKIDWFSEEFHFHNASHKLEIIYENLCKKSLENIAKLKIFSADSAMQKIFLRIAKKLSIKLKPVELIEGEFYDISNFFTFDEFIYLKPDYLITLCAYLYLTDMQFDVQFNREFLKFKNIDFLIENYFKFNFSLKNLHFLISNNVLKKCHMQYIEYKEDYFSYIDKYKNYASIILNLQSKNIQEKILCINHISPLEKLKLLNLHENLVRNNLLHNFLHKYLNFYETNERGDFSWEYRYYAFIIYAKLFPKSSENFLVRYLFDRSNKLRDFLIENIEMYRTEELNIFINQLDLENIFTVSKNTINLLNNKSRNNFYFALLSSYNRANKKIAKEIEKFADEILNLKNNFLHEKLKKWLKFFQLKMNHGPVQIEL